MTGRSLTANDEDSLPPSPPRTALALAQLCIVPDVLVELTQKQQGRGKTQETPFCRLGAAQAVALEIPWSVVGQTFSVKRQNILEACPTTRAGSLAVFVIGGEGSAGHEEI